MTWRPSDTPVEQGSVGYLDSELYKESERVIEAYRKEIKRAAAELRRAYHYRTDWRIVAKAIEILERAAP